MYYYGSLGTQIYIFMKVKLLFLVLVAIAISSTAQAYDFSAVVPSGQTLFYNIKSPNEVEVTKELDFLPYNHNRPEGALIIPDSVIYKGIFYSVTSIEWSAFYDCNELTSVVIPSSVISIRNDVFRRCNGLTSVIVAEGNKNFSSKDGVFFNKNGDTLICYPKGRSGKYKIPKSVSSIGDYAFFECIELISIKIPNSVTSIGKFSFGFCYGLTSISIPNSVISVGYSAFSNCIKLNSIVLPNSITSIKPYTFLRCKALTSISIPKSVTSIGDFAFYKCIGLTSITCKSKNPPAIGGDRTFYDVNKTIPVYVHNGLESKYLSAPYWKDFINFNRKNAWE